jgi:uncharacterized protein
MNQKQRQILLNIELAVKRQMSKEGTGHDWWHVSRVLKNSKKIAASLTKADSFLIQAAALLHDIRDWKFSGGDEEAGPREADRLLKKYGTEKESRIRVSQIIRELSYKGAENRSFTKILPPTKNPRAIVSIIFMKNYCFSNRG